jgi:hypothetical protein
MTIVKKIKRAAAWVVRLYRHWRRCGGVGLSTGGGKDSSAGGSLGVRPHWLGSTLTTTAELVSRGWLRI